MFIVNFFVDPMRVYLSNAHPLLPGGGHVSCDQDHGLQGLPGGTSPERKGQGTHKKRYACLNSLS